MGAFRFVLHFLVVAPLRYVFSGRWMRKGAEQERAADGSNAALSRAYVARVRAAMEVERDQERLAVRYGPLGWGPLGLCPHRSGQRFYRVIATGAIVRTEPVRWGDNGEHHGRSSSVLTPDGTVGHTGVGPSDAEEREAAAGRWRRIA